MLSIFSARFCLEMANVSVLTLTTSCAELLSNSQMLNIFTYLTNYNAEKHLILIVRCNNLCTITDYNHADTCL